MLICIRVCAILYDIPTMFFLQPPFLNTFDSLLDSPTTTTNMSFQANYDKVCRTCLSETCSLQSIFSMQEIMEQTVILSEMLMSCASVQVFRGDGLPENVCLNCVLEMHRAFLFRKLCEKSDMTLRDCLNTQLPLHNDSHLLNEKLVEETHNFKFSYPEGPTYDFENNTNKADSIDYSQDDYVTSELDNSNSNDNDKVQHPEECKSKRKRYSCKECHEMCSGLGAYRRHMANNHGKIHKCGICSKTFKSETVLNRHKSTHEQNQDRPISPASKSKSNRKTGIVKKRNLPRTCTICNKTFRFHSNLERHKLIHTGEKPYLCNVCGKGFAQLSYLKIHSFIHTGEKPYKCQMCEKCFAAPGTLMTHIRTHTGERPHVCKICGKDFPQSGYLSAHIRTHTGEKPVECKVCQRRFNQSGRLIIHMRIHSGEKPYPCRECGRSFAVKGTLKKHIRTHTGERPYVCSVCGQAFAQSGTLATHMKVHKQKDLTEVEVVKMEGNVG